MNRPARFQRGGRVCLARGLLAALATPISLGAQESAIVRGTVVNAETGVPVVGAHVLVRSTPLRVSTGDDGSFEVELSARRDHVIVVAASGFRSVEREIAAGSAAGVSLRIRLERLLFEVPSLNVTVNRGTRPGDASASVAVISGDELERRNVTGIDEALPFAQGVTFNAGYIDIRGSSGIARGVGSRVLMLLDGHRTLSGVESSADFGVLPILGVERIEVVKGPHSALWGTNALGGVVNVITSPPLGRTRTVARAYYGFFDTPGDLSFTDERLSMRGVQLQHSRKIGPGHATVFLGRESSDGFRQNGRMDRWRARAKTIFGAESATPWELFATWNREHAEEFFTWLSADRRLEVDPQDLEDYKLLSDLIVGLTATPLATSRLKLELRPQIQRFRSENHFHDNEDYHLSTRYGADVQLSLFMDDRHAVTVGGEAAYTVAESNFLATEPDATGAEPNVVGLAPNVTDLAVFGQDEIELSERLQASVGVRFDVHRASYVEDDLALNPKIGVVYRPSERLSLRTSVSRGYRAPSVSERFTSTTVFDYRVVPNLELRGESAWAGEIGATVTSGERVWGDAGLFWSEYSGLIEVGLSPVEYLTYQFRNVPEARVGGVDTGVRVRVMPEKLGLRANYMFLDSRDLRTGKQLPYRSRHNLTATLSGWDDVIAVDLQYRSRPDVVLQYVNDERGPITLVDLRLNLRVIDMDVQTKVSNLFQAEYVDVQERNPGASRSFRVAVTSSF